MRKQCESLDELLEFFESNIGNNPRAIELEDEKIIGTPVTSSYHK